MPREAGTSRVRSEGGMYKLGQIPREAGTSRVRYLGRQVQAGSDT